MTGPKGCYLTTYDLNVLDRACEPLVKAFGRCVYLVGSAMQRPDFRDVDVRVILHDDEFDALFGPRRQFWGLVCLTTTMYLRAATGLPIDFQVQRMTEANALDGTPRNPLGFGRREFAGGGDATRFEPVGANDVSGPVHDCGCPIRVSRRHLAGCPKHQGRCCDCCQTHVAPHKGCWPSVPVGPTKEGKQ